MSLTLGKSFDREYKLQLQFLDNFYNIGIFFNKKSSFVLFSIDSEIKNNSTFAKINMFKNLESSKFSETFLELHNYKKNNLDIVNQFHAIKPDYHCDINFVLNETINLAKIELDDRTLYETLTVYGLSLTTYPNEFIFLIAERQNIIRKLNKKVVRTTAVQIATSQSLSLVNEFYDEYKKYKNPKNIYINNNDDIIKL